MARVQLHSARTNERDPIAAAEDLLKQLPSIEPKLVTVYASRNRDPHALNKALRERLPPGTRLIGASTAGEIDREGIHAGTVVLGALTGDLEVGIGIAMHLSADASAAGARAISRACDELGTRPADLDPNRYVGLVIDDGFRHKKEELLLGILDRNQALMLTGGGAADDEADPEKQSAIIHVDGEIHTDAALVALIRTEAPWAVLRSHAYLPTGNTIRITKTDATCKRVLEIDGQPAAKRYAEILGVGVDDLEFGKPQGFANNPTALKVGREYFMRAPWAPMPDGSILFANLMQEDTELELMKLGDMPAITRNFFEEVIPKRVMNPQAVLSFQCSGRMWLARSNGTLPELSRAFQASPPSVGLNCFFEIYSGFHINTTLTTLVFGSHE